jgi:hypothetical protein
MVRELPPVLVKRKYSFGPSHTGEIYPLEPLEQPFSLSDAAHACQGLLSYNLYRANTVTDEKY